MKQFTNLSRRLVAEVLEHRESPSSSLHLMSTVLTNPAVLLGLTQGSNAPAVISEFRAVVGPNGQVTFSGLVTDDQDVTGLIVRIQGTGIDLSAVVGSDGRFQVTTTVSASTDIMVTASVVDALGLAGQSATTIFTPSAGGSAGSGPSGGGGGGTSTPGGGTSNPGGGQQQNGIPSLTDVRVETIPGGNAFIVSGRMLDDQPVAGCIVTITGPGIFDVATVLADGTFSRPVFRNFQGDFTITLVGRDADNNPSAPVQVLVPGI